MVFDVIFEQTSQRLPVTFDNFQKVKIVEGVEIYEGTYDVTPLITSQVLPTNEKYMKDDVRIDMIPTREVQNASGGVTFIVG